MSLQDEAYVDTNSTETQLESTVRFFLVITHADPIQIGSRYELETSLGGGVNVFSSSQS